ncbi:MAG: hypothetical protein M0T72_02305 [Candidatus Dormibacteraeota bacterium]|nr:hypothetical protein [Candidatus Dormibacteraeota bacterium]
MTWPLVVVGAYLAVGILIWLLFNAGCLLLVLAWNHHHPSVHVLSREVQEALGQGMRPYAAPITILDWPTWVAPHVVAAIRRLIWPD